ncbi:AAA family ATPase [Vampirovibrio chlorellavorus]|uniref:AAA family ATPase n=1 Tax=Vampirovibrio chlorellavorus TaxID=758823 RepID=UPI0026EB7259|nr:MoxR family ATPase [Vampirovibrio chlorellavorus]
MSRLSESQAQESQALLERVLYELKKVIVGQEHLLERLLVAVIAGGHVLVEGAPGLAKTLTLKCLSQVMDLAFKRIQFTPDLLPSDLVGTRIYNPNSGLFSTEVGPLFANFVLADEINRAPAKVQSALLEAMQEHQVTIGKETFTLSEPFMVMATQNPIESEGTFPLPEAQLDRFLFKLIIDYPSAEEELVIIQRMSGEVLPSLEAILDQTRILEVRQQAQTVYLDPKLMQYIVALIDATRRPEQKGIQYGSSPRGSLALAHASKALALMNGRTYVTPGDIEKLIHDCLRHRIILSYEGLASGLTPDNLLKNIQADIPAPVMTGA